MATEREFQIGPIVTESLVHNTKTLSNLQSLTASLFGVAAGILGLESYNGFLFYALFSFLTAFLFYLVRIAPAFQQQKKTVLLDTSLFFRGPWELWTGGLLGGSAGFVLTWTLFFGLVRS